MVGFFSNVGGYYAFRPSFKVSCLSHRFHLAAIASVAHSTINSLTPPREAILITL
jgi:hypothetical protein